jgi:hypothetical protein
VSFGHACAVTVDGPRLRDPNNEDTTVRYSVLSPRAIAAWAVLIVLVGVGVAVWLLLAYTGGDAGANRVQLEAIRTAGTVVIGTGGAAALLLAARRQRSTEIALKQKDRDQKDVARAHALQEQVAEQARRHQERVATATEADAEARRITDLYTKAVEQLGSDKAPVRLGGMYALERLAHDNPSQRQTIVNVLCAYLRMPYNPPKDEAPNADTERDAWKDHQARVEERTVRRAVQDLLAKHLRRGGRKDRSPVTFWEGIELDLAGATLIEFSLDFCTVRSAIFDNATFMGHTLFRGTTFFRDARFGVATFTGVVDFSSTNFSTMAIFGRATFNRLASFREANFREGVTFVSAVFTDAANFRGATFAKHAYFKSVAFAGTADFKSTTFTVPSANIMLTEATFTNGVPPQVAQFLR